MKKALLLLLTVSLCFVTVLTLSGCSIDTLIDMLPTFGESPPPSEDDEVKEQHVHAFGEWSESVAPTCVTQGKDRHYCSCGEFEERSTEPTGVHIWGISNRCDVCGEDYEYTESLTFAPAPGGEGYVITSAPKKTNITIPLYHNGQPIVGIADGAFKDCSSLKKIDIPDTVTSIGSGAFSGCKSLTEVNLPDSLTSIGESAF